MKMIFLLLCLSSCALLPEFLTLAEEVAVETAVHSVERDINMHIDVKKNEHKDDALL